MKSRKKLAVVMCTLAVIVFLPIAAFAKSDYYESTLLVSPGALHTGSVRSYDYKNHKILIRADELLSPGNSSTNKVVIMIGTKGLFGDFKQKARKVQNLVEGQTTTTEMGNIGSGKKLYQFGGYSNAGTGLNGIGTYYSGVKSNYVKMSSYE